MGFRDRINQKFADASMDVQIRGFEKLVDMHKVDKATVLAKAHQSMLDNAAKIIQSGSTVTRDDMYGDYIKTDDNNTYLREEVYGKKLGIVKADIDELVDMVMGQVENMTKFKAKIATDIAEAKSRGFKPVPGTKTGRNDPCPCGSGKKFKKCCLPMFG